VTVKPLTLARLELALRVPRAMRSASKQIEERARRHDGNPVVLLEHQQVCIPSNDGIGEDSIVPGVPADALRPGGDVGQIGERGEVRKPKQGLVRLSDIPADLRQLQRRPESGRSFG